MSDSVIVVNEKEWSRLFDELRAETDRGAAILASAWIDALMKRKLEQLFCEGSSQERRRLFDYGGAFSSFSAKALACRCLGWLDANVKHDIDVLRRIRNKFAHESLGLVITSTELKTLVSSFRLPRMEFDDWDDLSASTIDDGRGVVLSVDQSEGKDVQLDLTAFRFRWSLSIVIYHVAKSLGVPMPGNEANVL